MKGTGWSLSPFPREVYGSEDRFLFATKMAKSRASCICVCRCLIQILSKPRALTGPSRNSATTIPLWLTERQRAFFHSTCNWVFNLGGDEVTFALILLSSDRMATVSPVLVRRNIPLPP
jgi:hypothetical protein